MIQGFITNKLLVKRLSVQLLLWSSASLAPTEGLKGSREPLPQYKAEVYYFPFNGMPYVEVNEHDIKERWDLTSCVSSKIDEIVKMLNADFGNQGEYCSGAIRLNVTLRGGDVYFMDVSGNVKFTDARHKRTTYHLLTRTHREELHKFILERLPRD